MKTSEASKGNKQAAVLQQSEKPLSKAKGIEQTKNRTAPAKTFVHGGGASYNPNPLNLEIGSKQGNQKLEVFNGYQEDDGDSSGQPKVVDITDDFDQHEPAQDSNRQYLDNRAQFFSSSQAAKKELLAEDTKKRTKGYKELKKGSRNSKEQGAFDSFDSS